MNSVFFSGSNPNLIRSVTANKINQVINKGGKYELPSMNSLFGNIYTDYIKPYAFIYKSNS